RTKPRSGLTFCHSRRPRNDMWVHRPTFFYTTRISGWTNIILNQPGQADIQLDLFYDYQNNVKSYPKWQQWLRDHQPPMLVLWGKYDTSFTVAGAEAYHRDNPRAEGHILDAGHFAMDLKAGAIIELTQAFMEGLSLRSEK